jgi:hypothetical protein
MIIILLHGFSQSGKDYIGNIICNKYGYKRFAFADSLKQIVSEIYDCPIDILHSQEGKIQICENDFKKRTFRQILIDEALRLRSLDEGVFAKRTCQDIRTSKSDKIIITDWRFPNELDIIQEHFPDSKRITIHIIREGQNKSQVMDISEYLLKDNPFDYTIHNNMNYDIINDIDNLINTI